MPALQNNTTSDDDERRKSKRHALENQPPLTAMSGGKIHTCYIQDISVDGVKLGFKSDIPEGKVIALEHPTAGTICGQCVWKGDQTLGVELQMPVGQLERVLKCICLVI